MTRNTTLKLLAALVTLFAIFLTVDKAPSDPVLYALYFVAWIFIAVLMERIFIKLWGDAPGIS